MVFFFKNKIFQKILSSLNEKLSQFARAISQQCTVIVLKFSRAIITKSHLIKKLRPSIVRSYETSKWKWYKFDHYLNLVWHLNKVHASRTIEDPLKSDLYIFKEQLLILGEDYLHKENKTYEKLNRFPNKDQTKLFLKLWIKINYNVYRDFLNSKKPLIYNAHIKLIPLVLQLLL